LALLHGLGLEVVLRLSMTYTKEEGKPKDILENTDFLQNPGILEKGKPLPY